MLDGPSQCLTSAILDRFRTGARFDRLVETGRPEELHVLRRLAWARLLRVVSGDDVSEWAKELQQHRSRFQELINQHRSELDVRKFDANICNPLSRNSANPFLKIQANDELQQEIWKDIERTYPEVDLLQRQDSRRSMQRVLFHWCRANNPSKDASESYRQGMNELVAVLYFVVRSGEFSGAEAFGEELCGTAHTEADTFVLFSHLMEAGVRDMFAVEKGTAIRKGDLKPSPIGELPMARGQRSAAPSPGQPQSAILARCSFIFDVLLKKIDAPVYRVLESNGVAPQIFLLRWLRLLFCREFHLEDTLLLWDGLFADMFRTPGLGPFEYEGKGPSVEVARAASVAMPLVDFVAVAMIRFVRRELLEADESGCMARLLKFPPVENCRAFCEMATKLRSGDSAIGITPGFASSPSSGVLSGDRVAGQGTSLFPPAHPKEAAAAAGYPTPPAADESKVPLPVAAAVPASPPQGPLAACAQALPLQRQAPQQDPVASVSGVGLLGEAAKKLRDAGQKALDVAQSLREAPPAPGSSLFPSDEVADLRQRLAAAERMEAHIKKKASEFLKIKTDEWSKKTQELERCVAAKDAMIKELEARVDGLEASAKLDASRVELDATSRPPEVAGGAETDAQQRRESLEQRLREAEERIATLDSEREDAVRRAKEAEVSASEAKRHIAAAELELASLRSQRDTAVARIEDLEQQLSEEELIPAPGPPDESLKLAVERATLAEQQAACAQAERDQALQRSAHAEALAAECEGKVKALLDDKIQAESRASAAVEAVEEQRGRLDSAGLQVKGLQERVEELEGQLREVAKSRDAEPATAPNAADAPEPT